MKNKALLIMPILSGALLLAGCTTSAQSGAYSVGSAQEARPEDKLFTEYLSDIYKSNEIINGFPVEVLADEYYGSWTAYKMFAIADFDGDSGNELLVQMYGPYNGGFMNMTEDSTMTESVYPYFKMYEVSSSGEVTDRDTEEYKTHGDLWLMGLDTKSEILSRGFTFYDNAVFRYKAVDRDGNTSEGFYIFDDDIYRQLGKLGHKLYTDYEGMSGYDYTLGEDSIGSAICYTHEADGTIIRKVGSHQDGSFDKISKEDYDAEISILTGGKELDTSFRDINASNLGIEKREDSFEGQVVIAEDTGLSDITLKGTVVMDDTVTDSAGNPEKIAVLKLDKGFIYVISYDGVKRVDEVQLGTDVSVRDSLDLEAFLGRSVKVTGTSFPATTSHHHRDMVMLVKEVE